MVQINFAQKQINAKVVFYGPGMSGKTTNLEVVHQRAPDRNRGELTSISTDGDRTLFFDYMPLDLGTIAGMKTCFQMYTVPGQVYYNSTRKLVLQGVDGVIFVADSSPDATEANLESLRNLEENLNEYGKSLSTLPHVVQFNKRDIPGALAVDQMMAQLNPHGVPTYEAIAATGQGVFPTLKGLASLVLKNIQAECSSPTGGMANTGFRRMQAPKGTGAPGSAAPHPAPPSGADPYESQQPQPSLEQTGVRPAAQQGAPAPRPAAAQQQPVAPQPVGDTGYRQQPPAGYPQDPAPAYPSQQPGLEQTKGYAQPAHATAAPQSGPGELMRAPKARPAQRGQVTPKRRPSANQGPRTSAPVPTAHSKGGNLKTAAFVVGAAVVGAVIAHFVLSAL